MAATEIRVTPKITGQFGPLPAYVATPLAMVLTELLQNALQHGFGYPGPVAGAASGTSRWWPARCAAGPADGNR